MLESMKEKSVQFGADDSYRNEEGDKAVPNICATGVRRHGKHVDMRHAT
jgi:hypothetical protein